MTTVAEETEVTYGKTAVGQLLYDLAFVERTDKMAGAQTPDLDRGDT
jgi:hypothetical protein